MGYIVAFLAVAAAVAVAGSPVAVAPAIDISAAADNTRIVGGWEAKEGQFPYTLYLIIFITTTARALCGGSIIHAQWGLTAAHCIRPTMLNMIARVGLNRHQPIYETNADAFQYPGWPGSDDDIAIIKFHNSIPFNDVIQPVRIQRSQDRARNYDGARLTASGWGGLSTGGSMPDILNWVYLRGTSNAICRSVYGNLRDFHLCAYGYNVTIQSTCHGDSGGPLVYLDDDGKITQVGITTFISATGCESSLPRGFNRPGYYHDWIKEVTGISFDW